LTGTAFQPPGYNPEKHYDVMPKWRQVNLSRLLRETYYKGDYWAYKTQYERVERTKPDGTRYRPKPRLLRAEDAPERTLIPIQPAVVTPAEWDMIQTIITDRGNRTGRRNSDPEACLLRAGIVVSQMLNIISTEPVPLSSARLPATCPARLASLPRHCRR
jgi:hypothetical protein